MSKSSLWDKLLDKTSKDGFNRRNNYSVSPLKAQANTSGNWNKLIDRTSSNGFCNITSRGKKINVTGSRDIDSVYKTIAS
jgi:hypothetical protein